MNLPFKNKIYLSQINKINKNQQRVSRKTDTIMRISYENLE